ncbi:hypothetical protein TH1_166 [Shewanella phage Thanatos-1]|nr:hypothetical protein TH1_166 [Shewanella phage Thanatos-1]
MFITAKATKVEQVKVELTQQNILEIISSSDTAYLVEELRKRADKVFLDGLLVNIPKESRAIANRTNGMTIMHIDADYDYHNNVTVDMPVRLLNELELKELQLIGKTFERLKFFCEQ